MSKYNNNIIKTTSILSLFLFAFLGCSSHKASKQDVFLTKIRQIYEPPIDNFKNLIEEIKNTYDSTKILKKGATTLQIEKINKLKLRQLQLNKIALGEIEKIENDLQGLKSVVKSFAENKPLKNNLFRWELLIANLEYFSSNEKIVYGRSFYLNDIETPILDTIEISKLNFVESYSDGFISYENRFGINIPIYIDYLNKAVEEIYLTDAWYCYQNRFYISDELYRDYESNE